MTNYEYLYDEHGNWIGRNEYKTIDGYFKKKSDGEHGDGQWSMIRHISYKSPAEIKKINEERRAAETAYNDSLINAAKQYSYEFVTSKHTEYINRLSAKGLIENKLPRRTSGFPSFSDAIKPIKSFKCEDGRYSFSFNDGFEVDSVTFTIECGNEIYSDNAKYCLKWTSLEDGIVWIIARYKNGCSLDYTFDEAYDWKDVAQRYFAPSKDKKDEWNTALSYILEDYWNQKNIELECVNYIPEAYENGFKAPPAYSDGYKVEQTYFAQKNEKISKALCHAAFNACVFNNKSKPNAPKLKKFSCTDNKYTFVMNDKSEITDVTFDTELSGRDVMVTLSNDKKIALVIKRIYADYYIFVVKFENGDIKSINYISPKDARHFQHPQGKDLLHRYSTGYT